MAEPGGEPEGRAFARHRLQPDLAPHQPGQPFADGQPQPGAAVFAGGAGIDLDKRLEQGCLAIRRNADAGVLDAKLDQRPLMGTEVFKHVR